MCTDGKPRTKRILLANLQLHRSSDTASMTSTTQMLKGAMIIALLVLSVRPDDPTPPLHPRALAGMFAKLGQTSCRTSMVNISLSALRRCPPLSPLKLTRYRLLNAALLCIFRFQMAQLAPPSPRPPQCSPPAPMYMQLNAPAVTARHPDRSSMGNRSKLSRWPEI